ncbi:TRAP transporter large permease [Sulfuritalea hydrogenivorans]|jgi:tripartite ATP-independent transporter DctM subunit|uniref:TRAP transporter large permease protein n=1 Tax=Sulfuritalea hydrogenivorans sk43H TaxID=1223802 RepID=W0SCT2_9PROT|nr:TRAP transporter large permease [Sulfuritalea hydrogenivorans]MDK9713012.1 TRAP transporter large permease [Sulfuritalea sp.]BAO29024.1 C4-dicarboxylate uptake permease [Sulfuritalea hydrogenivorans sk43H]
MSGMSLGFLMFGILMALLVVRIPIGIAMFMVGAGGYVYLVGDTLPLLNSLKNLAYARLSNYDLVVIPLFLLMGQFATHGGLSKALFRFVSAFLGHFKGGVAIAAIGACAGFGAICGSSLATAATMGQVTLPELKRFGYSGSLSTGALAAGGTLGIMIPPSVPLVIYAILTQESIGKLFMAAVLPGIIAMLGYMIVIRIIVTLDPAAGPAGPATSWAEKLKSFVAVLPVLLVFVIVIVGIYGGWANPTEAAAVGAMACGILAVVTGGMRFEGLMESIVGTAQTTAMIFLVLLGADMLNTALAVSQMPTELAAWVKDSGLSPMLVMLMILLIYVLLGCVMDSLAMILLTIPIFYPMVMGLDYWGMSQVDKSVWFGILALMVVEIGLVHPPVGMNVYIINRLAKDVPLVETFKGVMPFLASDFIRIALLLYFPVISLYLVHTFQ